MYTDDDFGHFVRIFSLFMCLLHCSSTLLTPLGSQTSCEAFRVAACTGLKTVTVYSPGVGLGLQGQGADHPLGKWRQSAAWSLIVSQSSLKRRPDIDL